MRGPISISGLRKAFGATRALDGLDLEVAAGEVHGFLGPNGSGKTTTIRVLLGLLRADGGEVRLLGDDPWRDAVELHSSWRSGSPASGAATSARTDGMSRSRGPEVASHPSLPPDVRSVIRAVAPPTVGRWPSSA